MSRASHAASERVASDGYVGSPPRIGIWSAIAIALNAAVFSALLYRIGWVRTKATAEHFGFNIERLDLSVTEYMGRSPNSAFGPIVILLLGTLAMLELHPLVRRELAQPPYQQRRGVRLVLRLAAPIGLCLVFVGSAATFVWQIRAWPASLAGPLAIILGAALIGYRRVLVPPAAGSTSIWLGRLTVACVALVGFMMTVERYADHVGHSIAEHDAATLRSQPEMLLHSTKKLDIAGGGVSLTYDPSPEQYFHYRYRGLRSLISTPRWHILVPVDWGRTSFTAFPIKEDNSIRVDPVVAPVP